jgi:hypothetical protein
MWLEAEPWALLQQDKGLLEPPESGRSGKDSALGYLKGARPAHIMILGFRHPELCENDFLLFLVT